MPHKISLEDAAALLLSRNALLDSGLSDRMTAAAVSRGELHRIRRGWFVRTSEWQSLWPEGRHLLHIIAVARDSRGSDPVFVGASAAVLHGLPLYRYDPPRVEVLIPRTHHVSSSPDVLRHEGSLPERDIIRIGGYRVTAMERTVVDVARSLPIEAGVSIADAALRSAAVRRNVQSDELASRWRDAVEARLSLAAGQRGIRRARWVTAFADGRAQLPGESVSRLQFHRLGVRNLRLQVRVDAPRGGDYWIDFGLDDFDAFGEFDGIGKYTDVALRSGRTIEQVMLEEKRREDWIRGTTGRRVLRWGDADLSGPDALACRLRAFGLDLPGTR